MAQVDQEVMEDLEVLADQEAQEKVAMLVQMETINILDILTHGILLQVAPLIHFIILHNIHVRAIMVWNGIIPEEIVLQFVVQMKYLSLANAYVKMDLLDTLEKVQHVWHALLAAILILQHIDVIATVLHINGMPVERNVFRNGENDI